MAEVETMDELKQESLPVRLTEEEIIARGAEMADAEAKLDAAERGLDEQIESARAGRKIAEERIAEARREVRRLGKIVREGREDRLVDVTEQLDVAASAVHTVRLDTGEIVRTRSMNEADRQRSMFRPTKKVQAS